MITLDNLLLALEQFGHEAIMALHDQLDQDTGCVYLCGGEHNGREVEVQICFTKNFGEMKGGAI